MTKHTTATAEQIPVHVLDFTKINEELSQEESLQKARPGAIGFEVDRFNGFIDFNGKRCLVDTEFIAYKETEKGFYADVWPVYAAKGDTQSFAMFPAASCHLSPEQIEECKTGNVVTLAEFTKDRRGYNGRIERNEARLCEWLSSLESVAVD